MPAATRGARTQGTPAAMPISDLHASHIRRVNVGFVVSAPDLDPDAVARETGLDRPHTAPSTPPSAPLSRRPPTRHAPSR